MVYKTFENVCCVCVFLCITRECNEGSWTSIHTIYAVDTVIYIYFSLSAFVFDIM